MQIKNYVKTGLFGIFFGITMVHLSQLATLGIHGDKYCGLNPNSWGMSMGIFTVSLKLTLLGAIMGMLCMMAGKIYDYTEENGKYLGVITLLHYLLLAGGILGLNIVAGMPLNTQSLIGFLVIFTGIYGLIWLIEYFRVKRELRQLNNLLSRRS